MSQIKPLKIAAYNSLVRKANEIVPRFQFSLWANFGYTKVLKANDELTMKARDLFELQNSPRCMMYIGSRFGHSITLTIRTYEFEDDQNEGYEEIFYLGFVRDQILNEKATFTPMKEIDFETLKTQIAVVEAAKIELDNLITEIPNAFRPDLRYV